jgi:hypothetical protein
MRITQEKKKGNEERNQNFTFQSVENEGYMTLDLVIEAIGVNQNEITSFLVTWASEFGLSEFLFFYPLA